MALFIVRRYLICLIIVLIFVSINGCVTIEKEVKHKINELEIIPVSQYPDFYDDIEYDGLDYAINQTLVYLNKIPGSRSFRFGKDIYSANHLKKSLEVFREFIRTKPDRIKLREFIQLKYDIYQAAGKDGFGEVLYTGYYEPVLYGSLEKSGEYKYPMYTIPDDMISIDLSSFSSRYKNAKIVARIDENNVVPYYKREEIVLGVLDGKAGSLAWVKDPIDLFFLQIQGSGKVYLDNGQSINVHYHATNGHPYRSIGRYLINNGSIEKSEMSMQKIREYLKEHPEEVDEILNYNPSYVFFKLEEQGPLGCIGVQLTPYRSIALDRKVFPMAGLGFIMSRMPIINGAGEIQKWNDFGRFVLSQDTGGAIKGPGRADLFWGNGKYAKIAAGHMQSAGTLYFLVLKTDG